MNNILKRQYIILIVSFLFFLFAIGILYVFLSKIKNNSKLIMEVKERLMSYEINNKAFNDEVWQVSLLQKRLSSLEDIIVNNSSVPELLSSLESLAQLNKIDFEITSVQNFVESETPKLVVEFNSKGSYSQIFSFLETLQKQPFQISFRKLFVFSEEKSTLSEVAGTLSGGKTKKTFLPTGVTWQAVANIEIVSFK